jgi:hypothetical protein
VNTFIQARTLAFREFFNGCKDIFNQAISIGVLIRPISFWIFFNPEIFFSKR